MGGGNPFQGNVAPAGALSSGPWGSPTAPAMHLWGQGKGDQAVQMFGPIPRGNNPAALLQQQVLQQQGGMGAGGMTGGQPTGDTTQGALSPWTPPQGLPANWSGPGPAPAGFVHPATGQPYTGVLDAWGRIPQMQGNISTTSGGIQSNINPQRTVPDWMRQQIDASVQGGPPRFPNSMITGGGGKGIPGSSISDGGMGWDNSLGIYPYSYNPYGMSKYV